MRDIKFRAYSKKSKIMMMDVQNMYDSLGQWFDNHGAEISCDKLYEAFEVSSFGAILEDENCIVMQYTGLKDKNGQEIYEGDILEHFVTLDGESGIVRDEVIFKDGAFMVLRHSDLNLNAGQTHLFVDSGTFQIIGNIHESPQLLVLERV